jgi:hypothetical protein
MDLFILNLERVLASIAVPFASKNAGGLILEVWRTSHITQRHDK